MTGNAPRTPSGGPKLSRPTTGFMIIEDMLTEFSKTGRCGALEAWVDDARQRLAEFRGQAAGDRARREADRVQAAYETAQELVRGIHAGKIKHPGIFPDVNNLQD